MVVGQCLQDQREGEWTEYHYSTGQKKTQGYYLNGKKVGQWNQYNRDGQHISNYYYEADELQEDYEVVELGKVISTGKLDLPYISNQPILARYSDLPEKDAQDKATKQAIYHILEKELTYPDHLRELKVEGFTEVLIHLHPDGGVKNIEVTSCICEPMRSESLRIASKIEDWQQSTCGSLIPSDLTYSKSLFS